MTKTKYWLSFLAISVVLIAGSLAVSPVAFAGDDEDDEGNEIIGTSKLIFGSCVISVPSTSPSGFQILSCSEVGVVLGDKVIANSNTDGCFDVIQATAQTDSILFVIKNVCPITLASNVGIAFIVFS